MENIRSTVNYSLPISHGTDSPASPTLFTRSFYSSTKMKSEFTNFLNTVYFRVDPSKFFKTMSTIVSDPNKTDEQMYNEAQSSFGSMQKPFAMLRSIHSLNVLKKGMGEQANKLLGGIYKPNYRNYAEIYDKRYLNDLRQHAGLPLDGEAWAISDSLNVGLRERLEAGALFSEYPYKRHLSINENDCTDPLSQPEKTHKPLSDEIPNGSLDMISCLGGFHHAPADRLHPFVDSISKKLRAGGVLLFRDHDVADNATPGLKKDEVAAIAAGAHTVVNWGDNVSYNIEAGEIREFKSMKEWVEILAMHGFVPMSSDGLILKDDPTANKMMAFMKAPQTEEEHAKVLDDLNAVRRPKDGTKATWIEWGYVRFFKERARVLEKHRECAFDYLGHLQQHWKYASSYWKEAKDDMKLDDNAMMQPFILGTVAAQCIGGMVFNLPSALIERLKYGKNWREREITDFTALEKYLANDEKELSLFIDHTPFYNYPHLTKMVGMWKTVWNSNESIGVKTQSYFGAVSASVGYVAASVMSAGLRCVFTTSDGYTEPDRVNVLVEDRNNECASLAEKNIKVIHATPAGMKLISVPRYRPFTEFCKDLTKTNIRLIEIGGQKEISVNVQFDQQTATPQVPGARVAFEVDRLQDPEKRRYVTYLTRVDNLINFQRAVNPERIEYVHE